MPHDGSGPFAYRFGNTQQPNSRSPQTHAAAGKSGQSLTHWFNTSSQLWVAQPPQTLRTAPLYSPAVRGFTAPPVGCNRYPRLPHHRAATVQIPGFGVQRHQHADLRISEHEPGISAIRPGANHADEPAPRRRARVAVLLLSPKMTHRFAFAIFRLSYNWRAPTIKSLGLVGSGDRRIGDKRYFEPTRRVAILGFA
jgi:hypothetical protein